MASPLATVSLRLAGRSVTASSSLEVPVSMAPKPTPGLVAVSRMPLAPLATAVR